MGLSLAPLLNAGGALRDGGEDGVDGAFFDAPVRGGVAGWSAAWRWQEHEAGGCEGGDEKGECAGDACDFVSLSVSVVLRDAEGVGGGFVEREAREGFEVRGGEVHGGVEAVRGIEGGDDGDVRAVHGEGHQGDHVGTGGGEAVGAQFRWYRADTVRAYRRGHGYCGQGAEVDGSEPEGGSCGGGEDHWAGERFRGCGDPVHAAGEAGAGAVAGGGEAAW